MGKTPKQVADRDRDMEVGARAIAGVERTPDWFDGFDQPHWDTEVDKLRVGLDPLSGEWWLLLERDDTLITQLSLDEGAAKRLLGER
jgi:hypothetical protein